MNDSPKEFTACCLRPALWDALERRRIAPEAVNARFPNIPCHQAGFELAKARERRLAANREVYRILSTAVPVEETPAQQAVAFYKRSTLNV